MFTRCHSMVPLLPGRGVANSETGRFLVSLKVSDVICQEMIDEKKS